MNLMLNRSKAGATRRWTVGLPAKDFLIGASASAVLLIGATWSQAEEETWNACSSPSTDYVLQVPASLIRSTAPAATGCAFQTADSEFNVEAVVDPKAAQEGETIESRMQKEIELMAGTVTYQKKGDAWFVLSGVTPDGTEYYRKHYSKGPRWVTLRITYPHAQNKKYDKWVTRMEKTFVPFAERSEKRGG